MVTYSLDHQAGERGGRGKKTARILDSSRNILVIVQ